MADRSLTILGATGRRPGGAPRRLAAHHRGAGQVVLALLVAAAICLGRPAGASAGAPAATAGAARAATVAAAATAHAAADAASTRVAAPAPCGRAVPRPHYSHVVWILLENEGLGDVAGSSQAPYLDHLAAACGMATDYAAIGHPSLPNYLALTSGSTDGVTIDEEPADHPDPLDNLFAQLNGNWRALEESMPVACDRVTSGEYAARHNPAVYYTDLATTCARDDVPLRQPLALGSAFTFITPNICDDMHSCPIATGDAWLAREVPAILASAPYRAGDTVLFITFDEGTTPANLVDTVVVAPSVPRGERNGTAFSHYSLLRSTEQLLGLPPLGAARSAASMVAAFHL
jgi:hypothetical protein